MKKIKKIIGLILISSPFVGIGVVHYLKGDFDVFLIAMLVSGIITGVVFIGVKLLTS